MTFDQFFREVARRQLRGGAKSSGAEEITFEGEIGGANLRLVSRVRLNNPMESFLTSAGHRIRDSHVGREGYWVDLKVYGDATEAELRMIQELAQEVDSRPVFVRRA